MPRAAARQGFSRSKKNMIHGPSLENCWKTRMDISLSIAISYLQESSQRLKNGWIWMVQIWKKIRKLANRTAWASLTFKAQLMNWWFSQALIMTSGYTHTPSNVQMKPKQQRLIFCRYISAHIGLWCSISTTPHPPNQPSVLHMFLSENRIPSLAPFHPILSHTFCSPSIPKLDLQFQVWLYPIWSPQSTALPTISPYLLVLQWFSPILAPAIPAALQGRVETDGPGTFGGHKGLLSRKAGGL